MTTRRGRILAVPYPHEANDIPAIMHHHGGAAGFADILIDDFDERLGQPQSQIFGIALHAFIVGQPYRLRHLRRALEHSARHRDAIWPTTPGAAADWFAAQNQVQP